MRILIKHLNTTPELSKAGQAAASKERGVKPDLRQHAIETDINEKDKPSYFSKRPSYHCCVSMRCC